MTSERRILLWMCLLVGVNQLGFGAMVPSLPLYASSFGVSASAIGLAVAVYGFARFAVVLPGGQLSDRLGRRPVLAIGGLISAVGSFWCAEAHSFAEFNAGANCRRRRRWHHSDDRPDRPRRHQPARPARAKHRHLSDRVSVWFRRRTFPGWTAGRRLRPRRAISRDGRGKSSDDGHCLVSGQRDAVLQERARRPPTRQPKSPSSGRCWSCCLIAAFCWSA